MRHGKSFSYGATLDLDEQDGSRTAQKNSPDLTTHQTFRLPKSEKDALQRVAKARGVSVSTLLRSLITEVTDGNE